MATVLLSHRLHSLTAEPGAGLGPGPTLMSSNNQHAPAILPGGGAKVRQVGLPQCTVTRVRMFVKSYHLCCIGLHAMSRAESITIYAPKHLYGEGLQATTGDTNLSWDAYFNALLRNSVVS